MNIIAENISNGLTGLADCDNMFSEGEEGELLIYLENDLPDTEIDSIEQQLCDQGVVLTKPVACDARVLVIGFQKAMPPLVVIASLAITGVIGWQLLKAVNVSTWVWALAIGGVATYVLIRSLK